MDVPFGIHRCISRPFPGLKEPLRGTGRPVDTGPAYRPTQNVFRRANERLFAAVGGMIDGARPIPFLCECLDPDCRGTVQLSIEQFRDLRETDNRYAIVTGHPVMHSDRPVAVDGPVTIVENP